MESIEGFLRLATEWIWGPPLLILLFGTGAYLTIILKGVQFRYLGYAFSQIFTKKDNTSKGDISHYEALMTSLAGAIGTGSIVGVATAISVGGFGAIFWMWLTAFFGMATKYAESLLAVYYRESDKRGEMTGGPMFYIEKGLGWKWMGVLFAVFAAIAAIGTGNLVQVNSIAQALQTTWSVDPQVTAVVLVVITAAVLIGGVKSIARVSTVLVPFMALFYIGGGLIVILLNITELPNAIYLMFAHAFSPQAAFGGFAGAGVMTAIQLGVSRSVFSNEAGLGISSISAASAITDNPGRQAMISMTGALFSTLIVCTITALVIGVTGVLGMVDENGQAYTGASMTIQAFELGFPGGRFVVTVGLILFAYTTVIAWGFYGEKCFEYLFGARSVVLYRLLFTLLILPGAIIKMEMVWSIADIMNGLMVIPNLIALLALSEVVRQKTKSFLSIVSEELGVAL